MESTCEKLIVIFCFAFVVFAIYAEVDDLNKWDKFKVDNKCVVIEKIKGGTSTGVGFGANGQAGFVVMDEPNKTRFKCNDGIIYTR